ncbi:SPRY domain [Trinorchestia longiramus]|nr:SPRY domain [Trinorchestia longiramus]
MDSDVMAPAGSVSNIDHSMLRIIDYIWDEHKSFLQQLQNNHGSCWSSILCDFIHYTLAQQEKQCWDSIFKETNMRRNRLGPNVVGFPEKKMEYDLMTDPMGLVARENFVSVMANVGVYGGKWQYEVVISSSGVMQVGWATRSSHFNAEKGVGDTPDSYSYDGNRQRSWNTSSRKYGDTWQSGDVITCGIDMDKRSITYYRNGRSLGKAFDAIATGQGYVYFPAVSLSKHEVLVVNFGSQPLLYPMEGYNNLEAAPSLQLQQAEACLNKWFRSLLRVVFSDSLQLQLFGPTMQPSEAECVLLTTAFQIMVTLKSFLTDVHAGVHLAHSVLLKFISSLIPSSFMTLAPDHSQVLALNKEQLKELMYLLDVMHAAFDSESTSKVLQRVLLHIVTLAREPASNLQLPRHCDALRLLTALLLHEPTRMLFVDRLLFVGVRLQSLFCYCVDERVMQTLLPEVYWSSQDGALQFGDKILFQSRLNVLYTALKSIEQLHVTVLSLLLTVETGMPYARTTRARFLNKLCAVTIKRNISPSRMLQVPALPFFHSLLQTLGQLWMSELPPGSRICVPPHVFFDGSVSLMESNRLGGDNIHLIKTLADQRSKALFNKQVVFGQEYPVVTPGKLRSGATGVCWVDGDGLHSSDSECLSSTGTLSSTDAEGTDGINSSAGTSGKAGTCSTAGTGSSDATRNIDFSAASSSGGGSSTGSPAARTASLQDLCNCVVLLYHHSVRRSLQRVGVAKESLNSAISRICAVTQRIKEIEAMNRPPAAVLSELRQSLALLQKDCDRQVMVQAWHRAVSFAPFRLAALINLLHIVANTVKASESSGATFAFLPDYYIEVLSHLSLGLADSFMIEYPVVDDEKSLYESIMVFLCRHFLDPRIRYTDSKEHLMQTVAFYVTCPATLSLLEGLDHRSQESLVENLLQPYENRVWAQNNWILVRFWKGSGFAFRFHLSPHLKTKITPKPSYSDNCMQLIKPCPSLVLQSTVAKVLASDAAAASRFVSSLLNQLNWAFSEFIGMLQEIQNFSSRLERVFIDSRQLRICCTCFELTVSLLRVLEMVVTRAPQLFLGAPVSRSAQPDVLLSMLCKLLCHVMNRVSVGSSGCFTRIVSLEIPGLDSLHHYPLLTAAAGILIALLKDDLNHQNDAEHDAVATKALVSEPSFQITPFEALIDGPDIDGSSVSSSYARNLDAISAVASAPGPPAAPAPAAPAAQHRAPLPHLRNPESSGPEAMEVESPTLSLATTSGSPQSQAASEIRAFSLRQHPEDVNEQELEAVVRCVGHLQEYLSKPSVASPSDELQDCVICYARRAIAVFLPCRHSSCRACISQHLMNHKECFFCTGLITSVISGLTGETIISKENSPETDSSEAALNSVRSTTPSSVQDSMDTDSPRLFEPVLVAQRQSSPLPNFLTSHSSSTLSAHLTSNPSLNSTNNSSLNSTNNSSLTPTNNSSLTPTNNSSLTPTNNSSLTSTNNPSINSASYSNYSSVIDSGSSALADESLMNDDR